MNLKAWLESQLEGKDVPLDLTPEQQDLHGLTLLDAINAHNAWIDKLQLTLRGQNPEEYDPEVVGADHLCKVGKWIYAEGKDLSNFPEYEKVRTAHAAFHACAGNILKLHSHKKFGEALMLIRGDLTNHSKEVKIALVSLLLAYHENR